MAVVNYGRCPGRHRPLIHEDAVDAPEKGVKVGGPARGPIETTCYVVRI